MQEFSFAVNYYDELTFKNFTTETRYTEFTGEEYVDIGIGDV
jgi:hypothetical protein